MSVTTKEGSARGGALSRGVSRVLSPLHRQLPVPPAVMRQGPLRVGAFTSPLHNRYVAAWLGYALGWSFLLCFLTGLYSHLVQNPPSWFHNPAHPIWLYRLTQGAHVATGIATIPLLLAKLWAVYPRFWEWPPARSVAHGLERISLLGLVGGSVFQLATGLGNVYHWYFFAFFFTPTHFFTAWLTMGSLLVHVGTKIAVARDALRHPKRYDRPGRGAQAVTEGDSSPLRGGAPPADAGSATAGTRPAGSPPDDPAPPRGPLTPSLGGLSRRGFLGAVAATAGAVTLVTVGETLTPLGSVDLLGARKPGTGPMHVPINVTAGEAGVTKAIAAPGYSLEVRGPARTVMLSMADLAAMPQRTVRLPITCVEGWSASGHWTGVRIRDLLALVGAPHGADVRVESLQQHSLYRSSVLEQGHARDPLTLLATHLNGAVLAPDHGFPARLIAPNRPGVMQTKWVHQLVVLAGNPPHSLIALG